MALPGMRTRNLYNPASPKAFKLSRSKLDLYVECPRCFYLDRRLGVGRPSMPGWPINSAIDELLKREFDQYRRRREPHPLMERFRVQAIPYEHPDLDTWRENFTGVQYAYPDSNLIIHGAVDDVWVDEDGNLIVVDYKATSTQSEITLDGPYKEGYKRQLEIYQWLLRRNNFPVSDLAYILYANGRKDRDDFDARMDFDTMILPHQGNDGWVEACVREAYACLQADRVPPAADECKYCSYRTAASHVLSEAGRPAGAGKPADLFD